MPFPASLPVCLRLQDGSVTSQRITNTSVIQTFTFGSPIVAPTPDPTDDVYQVSPAGTAGHRRTLRCACCVLITIIRSPFVISLLSVLSRSATRFPPQTNEFFRQTWTRYVQILVPANFLNCACLVRLSILLTRNVLIASDFTVFASLVRAPDSLPPELSACSQGAVCAGRAVEQRGGKQARRGLQPVRGRRAHGPVHEVSLFGLAVTAHIPKSRGK
jgi:hypothetical protein